MEFRILGDRDKKQYLELRIRAAGDASSWACSELKRELLLFADSPHRVMSAHRELGTQVWGVYDVSLVGVIAVSERYDVEVKAHWWLWGFYVLPRYRGTPASGMLMKAALEWCGEQSRHRRLFSAFHGSDYHARQYLERWGFLRQFNTSSVDGQGESGSGLVVVERE